MAVLTYGSLVVHTLHLLPRPWKERISRIKGEEEGRKKRGKNGGQRGKNEEERRKEMSMYQSSGMDASGSEMYSGPSSNHPSGLDASGS